MTGALRSLARVVTRWAAWLLGAAILASMLSPSLLLPAAALGVFLAVMQWVATGRPIWRTPADWPILLLLLLLPMALWVAPFRDAAMPQALRLLLGILVYYNVAYAAGALGQGPALAVGLTAVGVLLALAAPVVAQLPGFAWLTQMAPAGIAGSANPNVLAGALLLASAFPLASLFFRPWRQYATLTAGAVVGAVILLGALILTRSRGALMGLVAMVLVLSACRVFVATSSRRSAGLLAVVMLGGAILLFGVIGADFWLDAPTLAADVGGVDLRLEIWSRAQFALQDFPFTGVGIGNFGHIVNLLYPLFLVDLAPSLFHAHNLFLQVALDLGLMGLMAWLAAYMLALAGAWQLWRAGRRRAGGAETLGAALLAAQVAVGVHGLTDAVMWGVGPAVLLWVVWGLALGSATALTQPHPAGDRVPLPPGENGG